MSTDLSYCPDCHRYRDPRGRFIGFAIAEPAIVGVARQVEDCVAMGIALALARIALAVVRQAEARQRAIRAAAHAACHGAGFKDYQHRDVATARAARTSKLLFG